MGRYVALLVVFFIFRSVFAQTPEANSTPTPSPSARVPGPPSPLRSQNPFNTDKINVKERFNKLSEDDRQKFMENFRRWQQMPEQEKQHFRERAMMENEKIQNSIKEAIKKTGLILDHDRQEIFALRYIQERRKIEQALRQEMEAKRNRLLEGVVEQLKTEFKPYSAKPDKQPQASESPKSSPLPSASP